MSGGRPTVYTPELAQRICVAIAMGANLNRICGRGPFPTRETVYRWFRERPEFLDNYVRAREARADSRSDRMDDIARKVLAGDVDPNAGRVALMNEQWQAGREAPKRYGDRVTHAGDADMPLVVEASPAAEESRKRLYDKMEQILNAQLEETRANHAKLIDGTARPVGALTSGPKGNGRG